MLTNKHPCIVIILKAYLLNHVAKLRLTLSSHNRSSSAEKSSLDKKKKRSMGYYYTSYAGPAVVSSAVLIVGACKLFCLPSD